MINKPSNGGRGGRSEYKTPVGVRPSPNNPAPPCGLPPQDANATIQYLMSKVRELESKQAMSTTKSGDKTYVHNQIQSSVEWVIIHNLEKCPSVEVQDSAGTDIIGEVTYDSLNQLTLRFSSAFSGKAYLN